MTALACILTLACAVWLFWPRARCVCGHPKIFHESPPKTGPYPHLRAAGCCKACWKKAVGGCPGYRPTND
jgi:hypothetical protein